MNSHDRRTTERYWPHAINVLHDDDRHDEIFEWLETNLGSCSFKRKKSPRWCWRPHYEDVGNFARAWVGTQLHFRKDKDYAWFLMKWDGE